jgi:hypothetical protein
VDELSQALEELVRTGKKKIKYLIPNAAAGAMNTLYSLAAVDDVDYGAEFITAYATVDARVRGMMAKYEAQDGSNPPLPQKEEW